MRLDEIVCAWVAIGTVKPKTRLTFGNDAGDNEDRFGDVN